MIVNLMDADKSLFVHDEKWNQLDNKNENALTWEFMCMLRTLAPTPWFVKNRAKWYGDMNIIVTGRLPQHEKATMERVHELFCEVDSLKKKWSFVSVPWDDKCETREVSYAKYVEAKALKLLGLALSWEVTLRQSNTCFELHVYEDDTKVLARLEGYANAHKLVLALHVVDKQGEVYSYP